jgi:hypothetical protein
MTETKIGGVPYITSGWYEFEIERRVLLDEISGGKLTEERYSHLDVIYTSDVYQSIISTAEKNIPLEKTIESLTDILREMNDGDGFIGVFACPMCFHGLQELIKSDTTTADTYKILIDGLYQIASYNDIYLPKVKPIEEVDAVRAVISNKKDTKRIIKLEKDMMPYLKYMEKIQKQFVDLAQIFIEKTKKARK